MCTEAFLLPCTDMGVTQNDVNKVNKTIKISQLI